MEENNEAQNPGTPEKEPDFKDIPILRKDNKPKNNGGVDPLASFTNILLENQESSEDSEAPLMGIPISTPSSPPNSEAPLMGIPISTPSSSPPPPPPASNYEGSVADPSIYDDTVKDLDSISDDDEDEEDILSPEFLEQQRKEWEKSAKAKMKPPRKKIAILAALAVIVFVFAGAGFLFLTFFSSKPPPPPEKKPVFKKKIALKASPAQKEEGKEKDVKDEKAPKDKKKAKEPEKAKDYQEIIALLTPLINENENEIFQKQYLEILKAQGDDVKLQIKIQEYIFSRNKESEAKKTYKEWIKEKPDSALANYLYAKTLGDNKLAFEHYDKSLKLDPKFSYTHYALAEIYEKQRDWKKAEAEYAALTKMFPDDKKLHLKIAKLTSYLGDPEKALEEYQRFLEKQKISKTEMALKLIDFAQLLPKPDAAEKYLAEIKTDPKLYLEYRYYTTKQKAIYKKLSLTDFKDYYPSNIREFHIIYLLSNGRNKKVKLLPTPPKDFPDFWKVFLGWKANNHDWKLNAIKLEKKYKDGKNRIKSIIARLWLERITPEEAVEKLNEINPEDEALFYFSIAEYYRKLKKKKLAKEYYKKALKPPGNIYKSLIKYYREKL